jgi:hypothetical protein
MSKERAVRVANVPTEQFEAAVEFEKPLAVSELAEIGKKSCPLVDLRTDPAVVAPGALPHEHKYIRKHIAVIDAWLDQLTIYCRRNNELFKRTINRRSAACS